MARRVLMLIAVVCFVLAALNIATLPILPIALVPAGLACWAATGVL